jgi:hypothetical protein
MSECYVISVFYILDCASLLPYVRLGPDQADVPLH